MDSKFVLVHLVCKFNILLKIKINKKNSIAQGRSVSIVKLFHTFNLNYNSNSPPTNSNNNSPSWLNWLIPTTSESPPPSIPSRIDYTQLNYPLQQYTTTQMPTTPKPQPTTEESLINQGGRFDEFNSQCGVPSYRVRQSTGLILQGKTAAKGQV